MSGHNKWSTIKQKKGKNDAARAKVFTKIGRELIVAIKDGGSADPSVNSKLKDCIAKAKAANVPNDNIERIIKKASSDADSTNYEAVTYEGYGPSGVAVIVEALTDNRNRTAGEVRHYFDKFGGNMGTQGCVSFMFSKKGVLVIEREDLEKDEDTVMSDALECGASDFEADDDVFTIYTETDDFGAVRDELEKLGYDEKLIRPAGMILCYPVITSGRYWHQGSFENLLGDELMERSSAFSLEKRVNDKTPKAFIWQTFADRTVPVQNSLLLAEALSENTIPFELHVYPKGKHGLGLGTKISAKNETYVEKDVQSCVFLLKRWLEDNFPNTSIFNQNG